MLFQLQAVMSAQSAAGLSRGMLCLFIGIQLVFAWIGYQNKIWGQFWGMVVSAVIIITILGLTFVY